MRVVKTIPDLRAARAALSESVGVVLTMGALHAGHLALVRAARQDHDHVLVTIFVNPTQFAPSEDLSKYPRPLERDLDLLRAAGVDVVFAPSPEVMYPAGFQTRVTVEHVTEGLEGAARPGHFQGVTTIVAKFFNLTQPTTTYFGQKDAQQVVVIRRMVRDLNFPLTIAVIPTEREPAAGSGGPGWAGDPSSAVCPELRTGTYCLVRPWPKPPAHPPTEASSNTDTITRMDEASHITRRCPPPGRPDEPIVAMTIGRGSSYVEPDPPRARRSEHAARAAPDGPLPTAAPVVPETLAFALERRSGA